MTSTFVCPVTGLHLERPPATHIRDEYIHTINLGTRDRIIQLVDLERHGRYTHAAQRARDLATYLDRADDHLHDLTLDVLDELRAPPLDTALDDYDLAESA